MSSAPDVTAWDGEQSEKQSILAMPGCGISKRTMSTGSSNRQSRGSMLLARMEVGAGTAPASALAVLLLVREHPASEKKG